MLPDVHGVAAGRAVLLEQVPRSGAVASQSTGGAVTLEPLARPTELLEPGRRILERPDDRLALGNVEREDGGLSFDGPRELRAEPVVVDEAGELEHERGSDGYAGKPHGDDDTDGGARLALGYSSWGAYFETEFGGHPSRGYQLLNAGRALEIIGRSTNVERPSEAQARELAPLLKEPEKLRDAWAEASENGTPTALAVREVVARALPPVTPEAREKQRRCVAPPRAVSVPCGGAA